MEEAFWHQKSRVKWRMEGDPNTTLFHRKVEIKNSKNVISYLKMGTETINDPSEIANHVVTYFTNNSFCR